MDWQALLKFLGEKAVNEGLKFVLAELEKALHGKNPAADTFLEYAGPILEEAAMFRGRLTPERRLDFQERIDAIGQALEMGV